MPDGEAESLGRLAASVNSSSTDAALSRRPRGRLTAAPVCVTGPRRWLDEVSCERR
jgi:hypothetical protein